MDRSQTPLGQSIRARRWTRPTAQPPISGLTTFRSAALRWLAWHSAAGNSTYEYEFARVPAGRESEGATHASELAYVFGTLDRGFVAVVGPRPGGFSDVDRR